MSKPKEKIQVPAADLEKVVNTLLQQLKQPIPKVDIQRKPWIDEHFGVPQSFAEILWRLAWLIAVPAIFTAAAIPIATWVWLHWMPAAVLMAIALILLTYWLFYHVAIHSSQQGQLLEIQLCVPIWVSAFIIFWEVLS